MKNLTDTLKILSKRKLSEEQMKNAIPQKCTMDFEHYISDGRKKVSEIHKYTDAKFAWFTTTFNDEHFVKKAIKREYDKQGLLTGKFTVYTPQITASWTTLV